MTFLMSSYTMYSYILAEGGLNITYAERKYFLLVCDYDQELFHWIPEKYGHIVKNRRGGLHWHRSTLFRPDHLDM